MDIKKKKKIIRTHKCKTFLYTFLYKRYECFYKFGVDRAVAKSNTFNVGSSVVRFDR